MIIRLKIIFASCIWYVGCVNLGRQLLYVHGGPGCEVSGKVVLEHVQTSERFALSHACLKGWIARCFRQQSGFLVATLWPCYIPFVVVWVVSSFFQCKIQGHLSQILRYGRGFRRNSDFQNALYSYVRSSIVRCSAWFGSVRFGSVWFLFHWRCSVHSCA